MISKPLLNILLVPLLFGMYPFYGLAQALPTHTPQTLPRLSGESTAEYELRKRKLTYGTPENLAYCKNQAIQVGRCKSKYNGACPIFESSYKSACVATGANANAAVDALPALNPELYYFLKDGVWLSRRQYCEYLMTPAISRGNRALKQRMYNRNCQGL